MKKKFCHCQDSNLQLLKKWCPSQRGHADFIVNMYPKYLVFCLEKNSNSKGPHDIWISFTFLKLRSDPLLFGIFFNSQYFIFVQDQCD